MKKICWVKWDVVCKKSEEGGLGIRNIYAFNLALLGKWRWRFLTEKEQLWVRVLKVRYGDASLWGVLWCEKTLEGGEVSSWWRGLGNLEGDESINMGWLSSGITKKVGNGISVSFWKDSWYGNFTLANRFCRLFTITNLKE